MSWNENALEFSVRNSGLLHGLLQQQMAQASFHPPRALAVLPGQHTWSATEVWKEHWLGVRRPESEHLLLDVHVMSFNVSEPQ